jgi:hypothetical protein
MKTPMQELIETFEEMKDPNVESSIDVDFAISLAKSMLEKEKEVMCEFADDYQRNCFQKSADDYYNETFNTKEK